MKLFKLPLGLSNIQKISGCSFKYICTRLSMTHIQ